MRILCRFPFVVVAAAVLVLAAVGSARSFPGWPSDLPEKPKMYLIDGYLDRLPQGKASLDEIEISAEGKTRQLFVTEYGTPGETTLDMHLSRNMASNFGLHGSPEEKSRLMDAPEGAAVRGLFVAYTSGAPSLLIGQLDLPPVEGRSDDTASP